MDRSFLSDPAVVAASRDYVCIRAATYENEAEIPFLSSLFRGRSPDLENTVFSLLAPDGKTQISKGGRSPQMAFRTDDNRQMINTLRDTAQSYTPRDNSPSDKLPFAADLRMGLNVAACDNQPLVVCLADNAESLRKIEKSLARHAWSKNFIGAYHYSSSNKKQAAELIGGLTIDTGIVIVQPDQFGLEGTVLASHAVGDTRKPLDETLQDGLNRFDREGAAPTREHVRSGKQAGVHWETATPITDSGGPRRRDEPRK
jgi:hypothetical protein